jgi:probable HAF family extracellular repeat protein
MTAINGRYRLKSSVTSRRRRTALGSIVTASVLAATMLSAGSAGAASGDVRYRLVDLGTLGGPNSSETQEAPFINNRGLVVGFADTAKIDPNHPGAHVFHAFRWHGGPLTDLGTLPGGLNSQANWSNTSRTVVGSSENGRTDPLLRTPEGRAVLWRPGGRIADLGTLGGNESFATSVNDHHQVVGLAANAKPDSFSLLGWGTQTRAFLWQNGRMRDLGTLGGPDAGASLVNAQGQVAGASYTNSTPLPETGAPELHPFLWQNGAMVDLGTLGGTQGSPTALNNRGQVAGESTLFGDHTSRPFLWSRGTLTDLGTLGGDFGTASWMNDAGEVVGAASTGSALHAFVWRNGHMADLGTVQGDTCSAAHFINASGQVVGTSGDCDGQFEKNGFISDRGGHLINLNSFVPAGSNLTVTDGETINDRGVIAGTGQLPNGDFHAVVLIPCNGGHEHDNGCLAAGDPDIDQPNTQAVSPTRENNPLAWTPAHMAAIVGVRSPLPQRHH